MESFSATQVLIASFAAAITSMGWDASAQTRSVTPIVAAADAACVAQVSGQCVMRTAHRSVQITLESGGMTAVLKNSEAAEGNKEFPIQQDLLKRVAIGEISTDDAAQISGDLANFDGVAYSVPPLAKLTESLGFTSDARFSDSDLRELVRAHLQLTLNVSLVTASYLVDALDLQTVSVDPSAQPVIAKSLTDDSNQLRSIVIEPQETVEAALPDFSTNHN